LQIRPDFRPALMNLGVVLRRMRRLDDATRVFEGLLQDEPDDYEALRNYGMVLLAKGEADRAVHQLRKAVQIKPCTESRYAVGMALYAADRLEEAGEIFLGWLEQEPDNPIAQHMAPAYVKQKHGTPARASDSYVRAIFDSFATSFERVLEGLDYQVPGMIGKVLQASYGDGHRNKVILDAGCGTGLCGLFLRPHAARLVGVDLSPGMLAEARAAENYDELVEAELTEYLSAPGDRFDVVVAADALCYFGSLETVFAGVASRLSPDGRFTFTLELLREAVPTGYRLNFHGRYSHTEDYVRQTLRGAGLRALSVDECELRMETGVPVVGLLVVCTRD
jgi:predicted TPR repeat methyltransferase